MHAKKPIFKRLTTPACVIGAVLLGSAAAQAVEVDVAIVYDNATRDYYNGSPSTAILAMVDQANTYLANSLVDIQLNLVATENLDIDPDLGGFRNNSQVQALREESGADFMTYISDSFSGCGIGYVSISATGAFNIVKRSCMARSYLHEMGHNMGLGHSVAQGSRGSRYSWGIGYGADNVFSTVMAYQSAYNSPRRTYLLSNPDYQCSGFDCGILNVADSARALNNVKDDIANHRDSVTPTPASSIETGTASLTQASNAWESVSFDIAFSSAPVVVLSPASANGSHPSTMRIRNVTTTGFEFQLDEWDYLDENHTNETISWLATTAGEHSWNGLQVYAGKTSNVTQAWKSVSFGDNLSATPAVFAQKEITNEGSASTVRMRNSSQDGVDFFLEEEEANDGVVSGDSVHYIAVMSGQGTVDGLTVRAGLTGNSVTDSWFDIGFGANYNNTKILSNMQTYAGSDTAALRYRNLSTSGVQVRVEEEASRDAELGHVAENVGWLVIGE